MTESMHRWLEKAKRIEARTPDAVRRANLAQARYDRALWSECGCANAEAAAGARANLDEAREDELDALGVER